MLNLSWVNISSPLPDSLGNLSALAHLSLYECKLQGAIPSSIGSLTKLVHLDISSNNFRGELPISIGNLGSLQHLKKGDQGSSESKFAFDWIIVLIGFVSGLVVGVILGNEFFTNVTEWFAMTFGMQLMRVKRRRGHRN
ncbi:hypothetical protein EZV62_025451 [Acer yangbiense]|uniref:Disease resistance R13L4/SHOC-2-like LRR domain-containing protein n=1 Tax=Acer yangbiense TaxID=1000413 RepID=A0A5C7GZX9_9ROSI|nr:hypothetical protein EZV62_025451 [Acer yangbiense]